MVSALRVSSDVFFYDIGDLANQVYDENGTEIIQDWAKQLGFGALTGIDLPSEGAGLVPTPEWRDKLFEQAGDPDSCGGKARLFEDGCYETDRPWSAGDNMNLAVGQGDLQATPAAARDRLRDDRQRRQCRPAPLRRWRPRTRPARRRRPSSRPRAARSISPTPPSRRSWRGSGRRPRSRPGRPIRPSAAIPIEIAGKTGTAEKTDQEDQSWYAALAPADDPKYVVVVTVERGGFGATTAAPAACQIFNSLFGIKDECVAGTSQTR